MQLYNTLSRQLETVKPLQGNHVGLYACGPTVYDYTHIGHLRKYVMDDLLVRVLREIAGFEVTFVRNITDVGHLTSDSDTGEDKLEKGARKYGKSVWDVAHEFEDYFFRSMDLMHVLRPDVSCRATDHIAEQLEMVKTLEKKGFAYVVADDGVYFDTSKLSDYGKLARLDLENLEAGARVEMVAGKRNPTDFALWKFERPGENRQMVWESPWHPRSYPGWHIECSAMAMEYLGEQFEIHTGGIDHIPVHHTNEIAQAEATTGKMPFVKIWVHHNHLMVENEKMSKSLGNFYTIDDVVKKGFSPSALRLLFLMSHYRAETNFTWDSLRAAAKSLERLVTRLRETEPLTGDAPTAEQVTTWKKSFADALLADLNSPQALAVFWEVAKSSLPTKAKRELLYDFDTVLGLDLRGLVSAEHIEQKLPQEITDLAAGRLKARAEKNWKQSDELRDQLTKLGYAVKDIPDGSQQITKMAE